MHNKSVLKETEMHPAKQSTNTGSQVYPQLGTAAVQACLSMDNAGASQMQYIQAKQQHSQVRELPALTGGARQRWHMWMTVRDEGFELEPVTHTDAEETVTRGPETYLRM